MKIAIAQLNYHIGNFESNISKIIHSIALAKKEKTDLIIFSELAVCGYPPRDFLEFKDFINHCEKAIKIIARSCIGIAAVIGSPSKNRTNRGKNLFNSALFLREGKIASVHQKALLPNYDVFDEYRYFEPGKKFNVAEYKKVKIAITICEDIWDEQSKEKMDANPGENGTFSLYNISPLSELIKQKPDLIINISASPFDYTHSEERKKVICGKAKKYNLPLIYVNHVGSQTELIFDGGSMVSDAQGKIVEELKYFEEDIKYFEFNPKNSGVKALKKNNLPSSVFSKTERIHRALILGIKDYFTKMNFQKALVGLSGGIDSALVLALAAEALGNKNVKAILMPSEFSSDHSVIDAQTLAKNLGCPHEIIAINKNYDGVLKNLNPFFKNLPFNIAEENIQARLRAIFLMAFTNKFGYILLNTTNKSEAAVGYGTLYGDMCGGLSVLGDVYKTEVYELANFINRKFSASGKNKFAIIPKNTIEKPPSAELRPGQKDSDSLPPYEVLDKILFDYIEGHKSPQEIIKTGFEKKLVSRIMNLVNSNEYKRYQMPPVLRISPKAFGMGRRMPIVGKYL